MTAPTLTAEEKGVFAIEFAALCPACGGEAEFVSHGIPEATTGRTRHDRIDVNCPRCNAEGIA